MKFVVGGRLAGRGAVRAAVERLREKHYEPPSLRAVPMAWAVGYLMAQRRADARREAWPR